MKMRPGEKAILPIWFRTGILVAVIATVYASYAFRVEAKQALVETQASEHGKIIQTTDLHFVDLPQGTVVIINAATDQEITRLHTGEDGFMRSVMRGMVRERKAKGLGPEVPFRLTLWEDGLVSLIDPATGRRVELSAFGIDNVTAFTRLMPGLQAAQPPAS